jgi:putative sugar O-methyltransferase
MSRQALFARLERLRSSASYRNYELARERVVAMKELARGEQSTASPSPYWSEELENIEYLLDASPLVIDRLRHHCYAITGIWPYSYRSGKSEHQHRLKLDALLAAGRPELFVPEPPELGGFGFQLEGGYYNLDTLKYFEVLIALDKGAVLAPFLKPDGARPLAWEIGTGWGGFAYQFKKVAPQTTYVLIDLPELFLFSATYLLTMFPDARTWFYGTDGTDAAEVPWDDVDFVFLPNTALDQFRPPRVDLTINMVSFQEMTNEQVSQYVRHAADINSRFLYSLNRERSLYNQDLTGVHRILERHYWLHEVEVLPVSYVNLPTNPEALRARPAKKRQLKATWNGEDLDYKHVIGWKRLRQ